MIRSIYNFFVWFLIQRWCQLPHIEVFVKQASCFQKSFFSLLFSSRNRAISLMNASFGEYSSKYFFISDYNNNKKMKNSNESFDITYKLIFTFICINSLSISALNRKFSLISSSRKSSISSLITSNACSEPPSATTPLPACCTLGDPRFMVSASVISWSMFLLLILEVSAIIGELLMASAFRLKRLMGDVGFRPGDFNASTVNPDFGWTAVVEKGLSTFCPELNALLAWFGCVASGEKISFVVRDFEAFNNGPLLVSSFTSIKFCLNVLKSKFSVFFLKLQVAWLSNSLVGVLMAELGIDLSVMLFKLRFDVDCFLWRMNDSPPEFNLKKFSRKSLWSYLYRLRLVYHLRSDWKNVEVKRMIDYQTVRLYFPVNKCYTLALDLKV